MLNSYIISDDRQVRAVKIEKKCIVIYVFILLNISKYVVVAKTKFQYSKIEITFYKHLSTTQTKKYYKYICVLHCFFFI